MSVADLLARTTPAEMASVSAIHQRAAAEAAAAAEEEARNQAATTTRFPVVTAPGEVSDEPPGASRLAKTIVVVIAVMLIGGAATAFSVLSNQHVQRVSPSMPSVGPSTIAGPTVMRPDLLNTQLEAGLLTTGRTGTDGGQPAAVLGSSRAVGSLHPEDEERAARLLDPALAAVRAGGSAGEQAAEARKVVRDFYELLEASPAQAYLMLGPDMQGDGPASFVRSWEPLIVELPQLEGGDGGVVRAVVAVAWQDATVLRTEQLLVVSGGKQPKIIRAALLSAHRG